MDISIIKVRWSHHCIIFIMGITILVRQHLYKFQLQSLQLDNFSISLDSDKLELIERAKYLVLYVKNYLSWDEHILKMCQNMNCFIHVLHCLCRIFPRGLLLKVYKSYIQSKLEYGLTIWGCTTDTNLGKIQRIQSLAARIISGNFDYINSRGVDIVRSLHLKTVKERQDYFLCVLMFKCIQGLALNYLCNDVTMYMLISMALTPGGAKIWIYTCHVSSRTFIREVFVIWLPINGIRAPSQYKDHLIYVWRFPC